jgi:hypothetical protein
VKTVLLHDFLGWFAANNSDLLILLSNLETRCLQKCLSRIRVDRPIYICGLARSGTTILLELISQHKDVATYRYKDFPLVMLPFWWDKFLQLISKDSIPAERSHADGIQVTPESPEAMEEILWMTFFPTSHDPTVSNVLDRRHISFEFDTFYTQTIRKLLFSRGASRYVAKNNYNVVRLAYLKGIFHDARFIIPVRDPVWHISSLMKQDRLLSQEETRDKRVLAYMQHSGHFEFGLDRRPLNLGSTSRTSKIQQLWLEGRDVEAWAKYWREVHIFLANQLEDNKDIAESTLILSYEELCSSPKKTLTCLYSHAGLRVEAGLIEEQSTRLHSPTYYSPDFTEKDLGIIHAETADVHKRMISFAE